MTYFPFGEAGRTYGQELGKAAAEAASLGKQQQHSQRQVPRARASNYVVTVWHTVTACPYPDTELGQGTVWDK